MRLHTMIFGLATAFLAACSQIDPPKQQPETPRPGSVQILEDDLGPAYGTAVVVTTLNVGAGSCQIISCPKTKRLIVNDCGSRGRAGGMTGEEAADLIQELKTAVGATSQILTISHPDDDHLNYIPDVVAEIGEFDFGFLGGLQARWTGGKKTIAEAATKNRRYFPSSASTPDPVDLLSCPADGLQTWILGVGYGTTSNSESMVQLSKSDRGYLFYFTGDMQGATSDAIVPRLTSGFYKGLGDVTKVRYRIMSGAHHGADTLGSNNEEWADTTKPTTTIFSAGTRFGHPRCTAVDRYTTISDPVDKHDFWCGLTNTRFTPVFETTKDQWATHITGAVYSAFLD